MNKISTGIRGVVVLPLKQIDDDRGAVLHMLRADSPLFTRFGEIYFSLVNPGVIKAWKRHREMTQLFSVPVGRIKLVIFDDRPDSITRHKLVEIVIGRPDRYNLVQIPPKLWYGFQGLDETPSLVANLADMPHDPGESEILDISEGLIPYSWV